MPGFSQIPRKFPGPSWFSEMTSPRQSRNQVKTAVDLHSAADGRVLLQEIIGPGGFQSCEQIKEKDESPQSDRQYQKQSQPGSQSRRQINHRPMITDAEKGFRARP